MKITNEAKTILEDLLISNGFDCLKANLQKSCCGTALAFNLGKIEDGDEPMIINGIKVLMNQDAIDRANAITIRVDHGELVIRDEAASSC